MLMISSGELPAEDLWPIIKAHVLAVLVLKRNWSSFASCYKSMIKGHAGEVVVDSVLT